jgi:transcriptional regulator with XRE-family HTH domain
MELRLQKKDLGNMLGVRLETIMYWESGDSEPQVKHYPAIIKFLGYYPFAGETETIGGALLMSRRLRGLTANKMGARVGVNGGTVRQWECNGAVPSEEMLRRYYELQ